MPQPIRLYLDFASPYAYFALDPLARLAGRHGRALEIRPILLWAILKANGIGNPMEKPARRSYFIQDMVRSAAFFGVPFNMPDPLQISAHQAARLYYSHTADHPDAALDLVRQIYDAFLVQGQDITDPATLARLPMFAAMDAQTVGALAQGPVGRQRLADAVDEAIRIGMIGSPFVVVDGEGFFGADRLPQIEWRLEHAARGPAGSRERAIVSGELR